MAEDTAPSYYYYIDPSVTYTRQQPFPMDDLINVYNLGELSQSVARVNPDGTKAVKLRKSYKNQVQELSGRFTNLPRERDLSPIIFHPDFNRNLGNSAMAKQGMPALDTELMKQVLQFDRSYDGVRGFDIEDLAFDLDGSVDAKKKRKFKVSNSGTPADDDDLKRRRME